MASDLAALLCGLTITRAVAADLAPSIGLSVVYGLLTWLLMIGFRLYSSRLATDRRQELARVGRSGFWALMLLGLVALVNGSAVDLRGGLLLLGSTVGALALERELLRSWFVSRRQAGHGLWASILVATGEEGRELRQAIDDDRSTPHVVRGALDPQRCSGTDEVVTRTVALARAQHAHGVIIVESSLERGMANRLVRGLLDAGLYVDLASTLADISTDRLATRNLGSSVATWIAPRPKGGWRGRAKRVFDVVVTTSALVLLGPVFVAVAVAVKVTSPGPVFFRQERVGRDGEPFHMLKFRSMVSNAEELLDDLMVGNEGSGPLFKMKSDPRVTNVGRFIRKTSLDELPQLINVLRDEMSLVGPRPALRAEMAEWEPDLYARLQVKPGITGMWQVSGRSGTTFAEYTRLDLYYVHNWSLVVDLTILLRTIPAVVKSDGAF